MQQEKSSWHGDNRRKTPRERDRLFQIMIGINVFGWLAFLGALLVFHYARPEFISGVQEFWGVQGRREWSASLVYYLFGLLFVCVAISIAVLVMKKKRNRREKDHFGINGYVLLLAACSSITILFFQLT